MSSEPISTSVLPPIDSAPLRQQMSGSKPIWRSHLQVGAWLLSVCALVSCASPEPDRGTNPVRLLAPLEFSRVTVRTNLTKTAVLTLMHEKVKVGSADDDAYLFLALPAKPSADNNAAQPSGLPVTGERLRVETVEQYVAALKRGASPFTTFDIAMDSWFRSPAATLLFLSQADQSRRSLLPAKLLHQLPVSILGYHGSDQEAELQQAAMKGTTLRDYRLRGKLQRFQSTATTLKFESDVKRYHLTELARGDLNHDGHEDSLVAIQWHYLEGSGAGVELLLVEALANRPLKATYFPLP